MSRGPMVRTAEAGGRPLALSAPTPPHDVEVLAFDAREAEGGAAGAYVASCLATEIPGWVEEARPFVTGRVQGFTGHLAGLAAQTPVTLRPLADGTFAVDPVVPGDAGGLGAARTFVGFDGTRLVTCGVACVRRPQEPAAPLFCEATLASARLEGTTAPPAPGLLLRALAYGVHHPVGAASALAAAAFVLGLAAVAARRRPRTRPLPKAAERGRAAA